MAYAALISVYTTIRDLTLSSHISLLPTSVPILKLAYEAVGSLVEILEILNGSSKSYGRKSVNALDERIKEAVWKFEDLFDSRVYHQIFPQSQILGGGGTVVEVHLDEIVDDIESFATILGKFEWEYLSELDALSPEEDVDVAAVSSEKNCKMVGSSNKLRTYIRRELEMNNSLDVISLVGMAGIGKTALAKKIFNDPLDFTGFEFECRVWVTIGRKWELQKLIRDILIQLDPSKGGEGILEAKRCLIVLDDVWDTCVWDHFKGSLPTYISGRTLVLLTTMLQHVVFLLAQLIWAQIPFSSLWQPLDPPFISIEP